nr:hypothetical protein [Rodentibacter trehalosifermentans]
MQYKTAWVLLHKFRESLEKRKDLTPLIVEKASKRNLNICYAARSTLYPHAISPATGKAIKCPKPDLASIHYKRPNKEQK